MKLEAAIVRLITMSAYRSGSSRTPLNKWVVKDRFQSSRILKENIGQ